MLINFNKFVDLFFIDGHNEKDKDRISWEMNRQTQYLLVLRLIFRFDWNIQMVQDNRIYSLDLSLLNNRYYF